MLEEIVRQGGLDGIFTAMQGPQRSYRVLRISCADLRSVSDHLHHQQLALSDLCVWTLQASLPAIGEDSGSERNRELKCPRDAESG